MTGRRLILLAALTALVAVGLIVFSKNRADDDAAARPHIIIVTLDTTRWDRMGATGYTIEGKSLTPNFDRLAEEGRIYEHAVAPTPLTLPSHTSLLTGLEPAQHGLRENDGFFLPAPSGRRYATLAEILGELGYRSAAFVSAQPLASRFGLDAGFDHYDEVEGAARGGEHHFAERSAEETTDRALAWLREQSADSSTFLWVHYFDPHHPHQVHPGISEAITAAGGSLYDAEIAYMDRQLGRLFEGLRSAKRWEDALVVVLADHGESLGDHGEPSHGYLVYDSTVRIPMAAKLPRSHPAELGARTVGLIDVFPTVLDLTGGKARQGDQLPGRSLLASEGPEARLSESMYPYRQFHWSAPRALRVGHEKIVSAAEKVELFDLRDDPGELRDLAAERPERARVLAERLRRFRASLEPLWLDDPRGAAPGSLAATGYLQSAGKSVLGEPGDVENARLADPRAKMGVVRLLDRLRNTLERLDRSSAIDVVLIDLQALLGRLETETSRDNPAALFWTARGKLKLASHPETASRFPASARRDWLRESVRDFEALTRLRPDDSKSYDQAHLARLAQMGLPGADRRAIGAKLEALFREQERLGVADGLAWALRAKGLEACGEFKAARDALRRAVEFEGARPAWRRDLEALEARLRGN